VWDAAQTFWEIEHYRAAVDAARVVNAHTQTKIGRTDIFSDGLMNHAFTEKPKADQVYLRLPGAQRTSRHPRPRLVSTGPKPGELAVVHYCARLTAPD
jgi:hypothetical protein